MTHYRLASPADPNSHGGPNGELKFEVELLRSKWTGLAKEVEVLEEMVGTIANEVKVANDKRLQTNRLIEKRDEEIESLRLQLIDRKQNHEEPHEVALLVPRNGNASNGHRISTGLLTMGSDQDNDIQIQSNFISRHHAQIVSSGSNFILSDLNSTNGTFVNSKRIKRHVLHDGDAIIIGKHHFKYVKSNLDTSDHLLNFNEVQSRVAESRAKILLQGGSKESM